LARNAEEGEIDLKHGLRPTRRQKEAIANANLDSKKWLIVKNTDNQLTIQHRENGNVQVISA
jgi:hypothetical protein